MARARKCRRVCDFPQTRAFTPVGSRKRGTVILSVDEYETIRLIDGEGLSQERCAQRMQVSRTTVQMIYASAREKLALVLVNGLGLRIEGGDYRLCGGEADFRGCGGCFKYRFNQKYGREKGETVMRIAVTFENGQIFQHFGHTEQFKVYDMEDGKVIASQVVGTDGQGHGALAGVLNALGVDVLICGGIGGGARDALDAGGIKLYGGVSGGADEAVSAFLAGELDYDPQARCDHHGHEGTHNCGSHGSGGCHGQESHSCHE